MNGFILGIGTSVPPHVISQEIAAEKTLDTFFFEENEKENVRKLYSNSGILKRHIVIDDFLKEKKDWSFWGSDYPKNIPGMAKRNEIYKKESPLLAEKSAQKAIDHWGGDPSEITHVISISCTGVFIPGIEFSLIQSLGLKRSIHRLGINFMGCFGAFKGLEVAHAFAKLDPKNRILVVSTELCSLHLQANRNSDELVANSIFGDGSAAVIIGASPSDKETPYFEMMTHQSYGLEDSLTQMSWEAGDHGFSMKLSHYVPISISRNIQSFAERLLVNYTDVSACDWAIHPGGKAIIQTIEKKLRLEKSQTVASWDVLENFGNMSSATFLFVLEKLIQMAPSPKKWTAGVGFGPGLSVEGILLQQCK